MMSVGLSRAAGDLDFEVVRRLRSPVDDVRDWRRANAHNLERRAATVRIAHELAIPTIFGDLHLKVIRASGDEIDYGLVSRAVVTDAGVAYIVDAFQNLTELENMRYHGIGTGTTAEAPTQTALVTELTTQYSTDNTRATGTLAENAANIFETVATNTVDAAVAITEHAVFSQAATGGGVMLDRSVFAAINLASGDQLQSTYRFTITSGS